MSVFGISIFRRFLYGILLSGMAISPPSYAENWDLIPTPEGKKVRDNEQFNNYPRKYSTYLDLDSIKIIKKTDLQFGSAGLGDEDILLEFKIKAKFQAASRLADGTPFEEEVSALYLAVCPITKKPESDRGEDIARRVGAGVSLSRSKNATLYMGSGAYAIGAEAAGELYPGICRRINLPAGYRHVKTKAEQERGDTQKRQEEKRQKVNEWLERKKADGFTCTEDRLKDGATRYQCCVVVEGRAKMDCSFEVVQ